MIYQEKQHHLAEPVATCGNRLYVIGSQNGGFPDSWGGHVPYEMHGVWAHPIKLLDGFWFGLQANDAPATTVHWLSEARTCRAYPTYTEFSYRLGGLHITRRDHVPDDLPGLVITLAIHIHEPHPAPLTLWAEFRADLRPVWLGEQTGMTDAPDRLRVEGVRSIFTDSANPWTCVVGPAQADAISIQPDGAHNTHGQGCSATFTQPIIFDEQGRAELTFLVAGSEHGEVDAIAQWQRLQQEHSPLLAAKESAYQTLINTSRVHTPNATLNDAMLWTKINAQWLARSVPEFGTCAGAGLPEYPWWFGIDTAYAVLPMLQAGQFELVRDSLRLLHHASLKRNPTELGRVVHEMSTNGAIYNEGNAVESPTFVRAVHQYWQWTGDDAFLRELYPFCRAAVLDYLLVTCDADGDLCPSGRSIIETLEMHSGVECIDVAAYTCEALERLADMATYLGNGDHDVADLKARAAQLRQRIQTEWWLPQEGLFADVRTSKREVREGLVQLDEAAARAEPNAHDFRRQVQTAHRLFEPELARHAAQPDEVDLPWLLRHWVVMCPVEVGIATKEQAEKVLARTQSSEFCNVRGMYLHPERRDVMSINTGLLALAAARNGHIEDALRISTNLAAQLSFRTPGTICEALPDQWCFVQLWSNLGVTSPVVEGFLGILPDAGRKRITIQPHLPKAWNEASVSRLRVGPHYLDIQVRRTGPNTYAVKVSGEHDLEIML